MTADTVTTAAIARRLLANGSGRAMRETLRISLAEMTEAMGDGTSISALSRWEGGLRRPRPEAACTWFATIYRLMGAAQAA